MRKRVNLLLVWHVLVALLVGETKGLVTVPAMRSSTAFQPQILRRSNYHGHHGHRKDPTVTEFHRIMRQHTMSLSSTSTPSAAAAASADGGTKKPSIVAATFNLIKACVGSGVLALPSGLALLSDLPKA